MLLGNRAYRVTEHDGAVSYWATQDEANGFIIYMRSHYTFIYYLSDRVVWTTSGWVVDPLTYREG